MNLEGPKESMVWSNFNSFIFLFSGDNLSEGWTNFPGDKNQYKGFLVLAYDDPLLD